MPSVSQRQKAHWKMCIRDRSKESADSDFSAISSRQQYLNKTANPYMNNKTVQWINATYAILTRHNAGNIRAFGGSLKLDGKEENGAELDKTTREQIRKMLRCV